MISDLSEIKSKNVLLKNGLNVHYLETGYEENKLKPCIIMLHGFPELSYSFRKIMLYIGKHGFHNKRTMIRFEIDKKVIENVEVIEFDR